MTIINERLAINFDNVLYVVTGEEIKAAHVAYLDGSIKAYEGTTALEILEAVGRRDLTHG
jgi:hypothetical protein